ACRNNPALARPAAAATDPPRPRPGNSNRLETAPMRSSRPWRKQTDGQAAARAYEELCQQPWYGLSLVSTGGGFCRSCPDVILLGPDLLTAMRFATDGLVPGCYAVRARIEATRLHLPDWG